MAFPSNTGTRRDSLDDAWTSARKWAGLIRAHATAIRAASAAGTLSAKDVVDFATLLADATDAWNRAKAVAGIAAYAQEQLADPAINIGSEFTAMQNAVLGIKNWIVANFPQDAQGYLLFVQFNAEGRYTHRVLTTGQTAGLRTQLDTLLAAID